MDFQIIPFFLEHIVTIGLGLATTSLTIATLVLRRRSFEFSKSVANAQGIFDKAEIDLYTFGHKERDRFIIAVPLSLGIWEIPLNIDIINSGNKLAEAIEIYLKINKELMYGGVGVPTIASPNVKEAKVIEPHDKTEPLQTVVITIRDIYPGQSVIFYWPLSIRSRTIGPHEIPVTSKDGINYVVHSWISFSYPMTLTISHKHGKPISKNFEIQVIDCESRSVAKFMADYNEVLESEYKKYLSKHWYAKWFSLERVISTFCIISFDSSNNVTKSISKGKTKININTINTKHMNVRYGLETERRMIIPGLTHDTKLNPIMISENGNTSLSDAK